MAGRGDAHGDSPLTHRKVRDRALILPLAGLLLLTPPIAGIFELDTRIAGVPFTVIYLFSVWGTLIAGAWVLSRQLQGRDEHHRDGEPSNTNARTADER